MLDEYSDIKSTDKRPYYHHIRAVELKWHFEEMDWDWDSYFSFISIRNPWDLMVSMYHYAKPDVNGIYFWQEKLGGKSYDKNNRMSFEDFIKKGRTYHHVYFKNGVKMTNQWVEDLSAWALDGFVLGEKGNLLVDYIIKVEEIQKGVDYLCETVGIPRVEIKKVNTTDHDHYRAYYNDETRKIVEKVFQYDIEMGKYCF
jgi:hypothetical protein